MGDFGALVTSNRLLSGVLSMEEALPLDEALRCATSLAEALRRMHRDGAVCGCLDPNHIVWNESGVKLLPNGGSGVTAYSSPEQVRGQTADARSDIFSYGAIVYELLSGHRAFPARAPEELETEILEQSPAPLAGIPEELATLLNRCLEKRPENRWQRINPILIELKLAHAVARQLHSVTEWKDRVATLRSQIAEQDGRLAAYREAQESVAAELQQYNQRLEEKIDSQGPEIAKIHENVGGIQQSIAELQKGSQAQAKIIEGLEAATFQTDEVVEHVVEAFGMMHKSMVERAEAKVFLVSSGGT